MGKSYLEKIKTLRRMAETFTPRNLTNTNANKPRRNAQKAKEIYNLFSSIARNKYKLSQEHKKSINMITRRELNRLRKKKAAANAAASLKK